MLDSGLSEFIGALLPSWWAFIGGGAVTIHELFIVGVQRYRQWVEHTVPQSWRIGAIITLFILGFVWASYHAWRGERLAHEETKQELSHIQNKQAAIINIKNKLGNFLKRASQITDSGQLFEWIDDVESDVKNHMGQGEMERLRDHSGYVFYGDGSEKSRLENKLDGYRRRIGELMDRLGTIPLIDSPTNRTAEDNGTR